MTPAQCEPDKPEPDDHRKPCGGLWHSGDRRNRRDDGGRRDDGAAAARSSTAATATATAATTAAADYAAADDAADRGDEGRRQRRRASDPCLIADFGQEATDSGEEAVDNVGRHASRAEGWFRRAGAYRVEDALTRRERRELPCDGFSSKFRLQQDALRTGAGRTITEYAKWILQQRRRLAGRPG